jgi:hypothetical protein
MRRLTFLGIIACVGLLFAPTAIIGSPPAREVVITNIEADPVPVVVTNGGGAVAQPVQISDFLSICNGCLAAGKSSIYDVPSGKRLVVEYVSVRFSGLDSDDSADISLWTEVGGNNAEHYLGVAEPQGRLTFDLFASEYQFISKQVRFYADPDTSIGMQVKRVKRNYGNAVDVWITISGYISDIP